MEFAGQLFAAKGFDPSYGEEICELAGMSLASLNDYYGGVDGLYAAVVQEAHRRFTALAEIEATLASTTDARAKLRAVLDRIVRTLIGSAVSSWILRVIGRELVAPARAGEANRNEQLFPFTPLMRAIVSELMDLPADHPAVARGCLCVVAPCFLLVILDDGTLKRAFPTLSTTNTGPLVHYLVRSALAGLSAVVPQ
jgi:AcrR family transcriptional regulator